MGCKTETKTIGDKEYSVTQWSAEKALLNKYRIAKVLGPAISLIAKNIESEDASLIGNVISSIFEGSKPEDVLGIIKNSIIGIGCNGQVITEGTFNEIFSGDNLSEVYPVFIFVLKVNYGNLLKGRWAERLSAKAENLM